MNYVSEDTFIAWYRETAKPPRLSDEALMAEVYRQCVEDGAEEFVLSPEKTFSGQEERYPYRAENIGACGASTGFMYF